ncbi:hypothetical protein EZV62_024058 [Acer yangbiense]|uniref:SURP motif domain-containing protein n=1 Tax=Acer yangbiense TaxID=1000413 RepID=A0A5C7H3G2_9ROSI|nr:hypothetical protein EZV62_024058 [Acer yangbiense]
MDSDEEDFVFYGTPIEREEEITSRRKKSIAEASGHLRALPPWKQEANPYALTSLRALSLLVANTIVTDEEGRRRFHGAFTGGFSAGYYNTAGSKEGWTPQSFTSSRKNRSEVKQQNILNFLDEDEKTELEGKSFGTSSQFDTFGFTAAELARKQAEKEQQQRPSTIPGPVPDELVLPATESIGVKLLLKMGWRRGRSIRDSHADSLYESRREARKALLAFSSDDAKTQLTDSGCGESHLESSVEQPVNDDVQYSRSTPFVISVVNVQFGFDILASCFYGCYEVKVSAKLECFTYCPPPEKEPVYVLNPKQDLHGLGYDPFKHAPEFRERKRSRLSDNRKPGYSKALSMKDSLFGFKSGKVGPGFGIGALEEYDAEDEDVYGTAYDFEDTIVQEVEVDEPSGVTKDRRPRLLGKEQGALPGFMIASKSDYQLERFDPPTVPKNFVPHHKFSGPLETDNKFANTPPPEVPPPDDNNMKLLIDGVATLVARCGKLFEDLSREKNQNNPLFTFLTGGNGHDYYARKLWEERQKRNDQTMLAMDGKSSLADQKMTAESRGKLLGEKPLERSSKDLSSSFASENAIHMQYNLSDTFTKSASYSELPEIIKPFKDDPAKQDRFERFLKEKYQGGLRSADSGKASNMSEAARAHERMDFEAVAEAIGKGKHGKESLLSTQQFTGVSPAGGMQFTSGGLEQAKDAQAENLTTKNMYPRREEFQWRPSPILCKRFDLTDPFMGKPPPVPRMRSKMDSLIFMSDSVKPTKLEESDAVNKGPYPMPQSDAQEMSKIEETEVEVKVEVENVERPVDLYKNMAFCLVDVSSFVVGTRYVPVHSLVLVVSISISGLPHSTPFSFTRFPLLSVSKQKQLRAIFSDDSDDEAETFDHKQVEEPEKKIEVAHTALNHLIAGDFLESLGKELGLEVPPELPYLMSKAKTPVSGTPVDRVVLQQKGTTQEGESLKNTFIPSNPQSSSGKFRETDLSENRPGKADREKTKEDARAKSPSSRNRNRSSSWSSEDERSRKRSRRHRYRSSDSYSDLSGDDQDRYHSKSKGRKKGSSREKSSSSRRKHHKHKHRDSPSRSYNDAEGKKEKKKRRERD